MEEVGFLPPYSFSFEIFLHALLSDAESANQRNFLIIIVVEARYVLFVRAGDGLLRLHYLHCIGDSCAETVAGLNQRRIRQINVAARHAYLISRRLQVQQRRANVGVDLRAQIVQTLEALCSSRASVCKTSP